MDLSVIIPAYNVQKCIAACLRSVTRCPKVNIDMECIVIDNNSTDETAAIVNRYIERDNRMKLVTTKHTGALDMRNEGVEAASGTYILFLDAKDRLCEDAWEQIEAAVEEEYADFVAFSYITLNKKGKFKARMLPLSDVISTDEQEAKRLLYADAVLNTCWGKLFKSRIIRDNNIFFRTDLLAGADFLFVAEYFEHCESYMMTKAMILYCPQEGVNIMKNYSMEECLDIISVLYDYRAAAVGHYNDRELMDCMRAYFFGELTSLLCTYAREYHYNKKALENIYGNALKHKFVKSFLAELDEHMLHAVTKRYEYRLLSKGDAARIRKYFSMRAMLPVPDAGLL